MTCSCRKNAVVPGCPTHSHYPPDYWHLERPSPWQRFWQGFADGWIKASLIGYVFVLGFLVGWWLM